MRITNERFSPHIEQKLTPTFADPAPSRVQSLLGFVFGRLPWLFCKAHLLNEQRYRHRVQMSRHRL